MAEKALKETSYPNIAFPAVQAKDSEEPSLRSAQNCRQRLILMDPSTLR